MTLGSQHTSDTTLRQLRDGGLAPAECLDVDRHLEECAVCRDRLGHIDAETAAHLPPDLIAAVAAGAASPEDHWRARNHAAVCSRCAGDLESLTAFADQMAAYRKRAWRIPQQLTAGLAAALVVGVGVWWLGRGAPGNGAGAMAAVEAAPTGGATIVDGGRTLALDANRRLTGGAGVSTTDSERIAGILREAAGLTPTGSTLGHLSRDEAARDADVVRRTFPDGHLLAGALEERAGELDRAAEDYKALLMENPGSPVVTRLLARVVAAR
jgi:hypothetical protein